MTLAAAAVHAERGEARGGELLEARATLTVQQEAEHKTTGRYDWGPCVILDEGLYKMWWVRLGGENKKRFPYAGTLPDGGRFEFSYPDWGDRIYYAESRDGRRWQLGGNDFTGPVDQFDADAHGPLMVLEPAESSQERRHVGRPSVIKVAGRYYMYYEACSEFRVSRRPDGRVTVGDEYHNQIFLATSQDGKRWHKHPHDSRPQPIVAAPEENKKTHRRRYGLGQPSVFHHRGMFVMHYVDSCTASGDFIVRLEAQDPDFVNARRFPGSLRPAAGANRVPEGAVARFAQTDVKYLGDTLYLLRPAYGTGNLGILATRTGVFEPDANARHPREVFPQVRIADPRGSYYRQRLYPGFLTNPEGEILTNDGFVAVYYGSGLEHKQHAYTWDIHRSDLSQQDLQKVREWEGGK